jgi:hypothetical protein
MYALLSSLCYAHLLSAGTHPIGNYIRHSEVAHLASSVYVAVLKTSVCAAVCPQLLERNMHKLIVRTRCQSHTLIT